MACQVKPDTAPSKSTKYLLPKDMKELFTSSNAIALSTYERLGCKMPFQFAKSGIDAITP